MTRIFIAGHKGMVGSALLRLLSEDSSIELITRSREQLDLCNQAKVVAFFKSEKIDEVFLAAAKVGGIHANSTYPAEFIYQNIMMQANVIHAAHAVGVNKLLLLGSSCIYPKFAAQPMSELALLTGELEPTNEPYAIAKIAGIKLCESYNRQYGVDFRTVMPTNLYGENDNFHPQNSHVIPAMLLRFHQAKLAGEHSVVIWGSGQPKREFLYVDDMASACVHVMALAKGAYQKHTEERHSHINVGSGVDCSIAQLAHSIKKIVGFDGLIEYDKSKPDGAPRKLLDVTRLKSLGWSAKTNLDDGLDKTYRWFLANEQTLRGVS